MGATALRRLETSEVPVAVCVGRRHPCDEYDGRTGPERPHIAVHLFHEDAPVTMLWLRLDPLFLSAAGQLRLYDLLARYREKRWISGRSNCITNRGCAFMRVRVSAVIHIVPDLQEVAREWTQASAPPEEEPETSASRLRRWADSIR
jgi:hypothetical protein